MGFTFTDKDLVEYKKNTVSPKGKALLARLEAAEHYILYGTGYTAWRKSAGKD